MKFASRYLIAAALAAAPVAASAQATPPAAGQGERGHQGQHGERGVRGQRGPGMGSPVQRILSRREQLKLTDAQVQRLQAIDRDLQTRNAPLQQQLAALFPERAQRGQGQAEGRPQGERRARPHSAARAERRRQRPQLTEAQRQQMQQRRAQAQPVMQQLRQNGEAALTQARSVLTAEQQAQVSRWAERRGEGRDGQRGGRRGGERGDRARGTSQSR